MSEPMRDEVELPELPKWTKSEEREATLGSHPELSFGWLWLAKFEREAQLQAALSANREKDAEIARLKDQMASAEAACEEGHEIVGELRAELSSLRASGGEKERAD